MLCKVLHIWTHQSIAVVSCKHHMKKVVLTYFKMGREGFDCNENTTTKDPSQTGWEGNSTHCCSALFNYTQNIKILGQGHFLFVNIIFKLDFSRFSSNSDRCPIQLKMNLSDFGHKRSLASCSFYSHQFWKNHHKNHPNISPWASTVHPLSGTCRSIQLRCGSPSFFFFFSPSHS